MHSDDDKVTTVLTRAGVKHSALVERMLANGAELQSNEFISATYEAVKLRHPNTPHHSMRELYGTLAGQTVFICGSGPSLASGPTKLPGVTFAINRAITYMAADFFCFSDMESWRLYGEHPNAQAAKKCFNAGLHIFFPDTPGYLIEAHGSPNSFTIHEKRPIYFNLATFTWVLHLAIKAGAKRIICVGTEFSTDKYYDGFQPKGYEGELTNGLLAVSKARMLEMFGPDKGQWFDPSVEILDASGGALLVPKTRLEDWL